MPHHTAIIGMIHHLPARASAAAPAPSSIACVSQVRRRVRVETHHDVVQAEPTGWTIHSWYFDSRALAKFWPSKCDVPRLERLAILHQSFRSSSAAGARKSAHPPPFRLYLPHRIGCSAKSAYTSIIALSSSSRASASLVRVKPGVLLAQRNSVFRRNKRPAVPPTRTTLAHC